MVSAFHLNNSHLHLMVHWAGKNNPVVFVLARDQDLKIANPTSNFYISRDYGKTFQDVSNRFKLPNGKNAVLEKFYNHPESPCYYVVTDTREKVSEFTVPLRPQPNKLQNPTTRSPSILLYAKILTIFLISTGNFYNN